MVILGNDESARQMYMAYYNVCCCSLNLNRNYMEAIESALSKTDTTIKLEERDALFVDQLLEGNIGNVPRDSFPLLENFHLFVKSSDLFFDHVGSELNTLKKKFPANFFFSFFSYFFLKKNVDFWMSMELTC